MMKAAAPDEERLRAQLLGLYPTALPPVYVYLVHRLGGERSTAEDLTADNFLRAVDACRRGTVREVTIAGLITIARNRLVDHWRSEARRERFLAAVADTPALQQTPWVASLDDGVASEILAKLNPMQRAALTLRHVDGLSVPDVAVHVGRSVAATETLLSRARAAFRSHLEEPEREP